MICGKCNSSMVVRETITTEEGRIKQPICKKCGQTGRYGWKNKEENTMGVTNGERERRVELGKKIKAARGAIPFTQIQSKTKIAISTLSLIESGKCPCTVERAAAILAAIEELKGSGPAFTEAPPEAENNGLKEIARETVQKFLYGDGTRTATVKFVNGEFFGCDYVTEAARYNLDDWKFLSALAGKIFELDN